GARLTATFPKTQESVAFELVVPRWSAGLAERFSFSFFLNGQSLSSPGWPQGERTRLVVPPGSRSFAVQIVAKRDLEPWNWGQAATVVLEGFRRGAVLRESLGTLRIEGSGVTLEAVSMARRATS